MKKEDRTKNIYRIIGEQDSLTTKGSKECGFNQHDLASLVEDGVLDRGEDKRGVYADVEELFNYGKKLAQNKQKEEAEEIYKECLILNPTHSGAAFQLFIIALQAQNYELAFHYFDICYEQGNEHYKKDYHTYLLLLRDICTIPEKYKKILSTIDFQSIKVDPDDKRFSDPAFENQIRSVILKHNYDLTRKMIFQKGEKNTTNYVILVLSYEAMKKEKIRKKMNWHEIKNLVINKDYNRIVTYFENQAQVRELSNSESLWFSLCKVYLRIKKTQSIPFVSVTKSTNYFDAIKHKDYEQAQFLSEKFIEAKGQEKEDNIAYLILRDINRLIASIKRVNYSNIPNVKKLNKKLTVDNIHHLLMSGDMESAFKALHVFLERNNLTKFEIFIVSLIKLSLKEKDFTFVRPMQNLVLLASGYEFDITKYKDYFYEALKIDLEEASLYLKIILNLKEQQDIEMDVEPLKEAYSIASRK